jgi:adenine-specific DNA-methyltransferase
METYQDIWLGDSVELCQKFHAGRINCVITDPPFGVDNQSNMAVTQAGKAHATKILNDESPEVAIEVFQNVMKNLLPRTADNADCYVFTAHQVLKEWLVMTDHFMPYFGFERKGMLWWEKDGPGMGDLNSPWGMASEVILFFRKGRLEKRTQRRNGTLHFPQLRPGELIHPHEKPTSILKALIEASTEPGDWVVDPFGGSGSLVRAAREINRNAIAIELDPERHAKAKHKFETQEAGIF